MKLNFIKATKIEDLLKIEKLARIIWPTAFKNIVSTKQINFMLDWMYNLEQMQNEVKNGTIYEIIYCKDKLIGFCAYTKKQKSIKMDKLYIIPEKQKMGIGSIVINHIYEYAKKQKLDSLFLAVNKNNSKAINAYIKNGFKIVEEVKNDIGNGFFMDDYIMEKTTIIPNHF
jgi:ribosomal protein S18 acetylase RimI-like enzyme